MQGVQLFSHNCSPAVQFDPAMAMGLGHQHRASRRTDLVSGMQLCNQDQTPTSFNGGTACTIASVAATQLQMHLLCAC